MSMPLLEILIILGAYLLGSISSAIIVCRAMGLPDPRSQGSHNPGATNVLRIAGKKAAFITLLGDALKGTLPLIVCHLLDQQPWVFAVVGASAFLGHLYPVFFGFRGGKGVATALGVQFGLDWMIGASVGLIWLIMAKLGRVSSLAALISMTLAPFVVWLAWPAWELVLMQSAITMLLIWRHRSNIENLLRGTEGKI